MQCLGSAVKSTFNLLQTTGEHVPGLLAPGYYFIRQLCITESTIQADFIWRKKCLFNIISQTDAKFLFQSKTTWAKLLSLFSGRKHTNTVYVLLRIVSLVALGRNLLFHCGCFLLMTKVSLRLFSNESLKYWSNATTDTSLKMLLSCGILREFSAVDQTKKQSEFLWQGLEKRKCKSRRWWINDKDWTLYYPGILLESCAILSSDEVKLYRHELMSVHVGNVVETQLHMSTPHPEDSAGCHLEVHTISTWSQTCSCQDNHNFVSSHAPWKWSLWQLPHCVLSQPNGGIRAH